MIVALNHVAKRTINGRFNRAFCRFMSFVPSSLDDFKSKEFWNEFFVDRKTRPFEWYCSYESLKSYFNGISKTSRILIPGCGNSELSAEMYDAGFEQITNLDFSTQVIREMLTKNVRIRPKMKWMVMDVTKMKFPDSEFEVVIDKGALDALMGDLDDEGIGIEYLRKIRRVLTNDGLFFCVSLLQSEVLKTLLSPLLFNFRIGIELIELDLESQVSELRPFLIRAEKLIDFDLEFPPLINLSPSISNTPNSSTQINDILTILNEVNKKRKKGDLCKDWMKIIDFDVMYPGRRITIGTIDCSHRVKRKSTLCFRLTVLDSPSPHDQICAVYIVPKGKEHTWLYSSAEGQWEVVKQCQSSRLILVHIIWTQNTPPFESIKATVSETVIPCVPKSIREHPQSTPILTSQSQEEEFPSLERAMVESEISGRILVMDCLVNGVLLRRMIFGEGESLIQTESQLMTEDSIKSKDLKAIPRDPASLSVSLTKLTAEYHQFIGRAIEIMKNEDSLLKRVVIVGLGGGVLPMYLHQVLDLNITVVELDPKIVEIAEEWFGFDQKIPVVIGDGVDYIQTLKGSEMEVLVVDAGGNGSSSAMSCPPEGFVLQEFMLAAFNALSDNGVMIVNFVTRSTEAFRSAVEILGAQFPFLYSLKAQEDLNRVVIARKTEWKIEHEESETSWKFEWDPDPKTKIKNIVP